MDETTPGAQPNIGGDCETQGPRARSTLGSGESLVLRALTSYIHTPLPVAVSIRSCIFPY